MKANSAAVDFLDVQFALWRTMIIQDAKKLISISPVLTLEQATITLLSNPFSGIQRSDLELLYGYCNNYSNYSNLSTNIFISKCFELCTRYYIDGEEVIGEKWVDRVNNEHRNLFLSTNSSYFCRFRLNVFLDEISYIPYVYIWTYEKNHVH